MWFSLLYQPLLNGLIFFYQIFGNLGWAIIVMTFLLRMLLLPLTLPSLKSAQKMRELAPELEKLKKKHKKDKQELAAAQMKLYRKHGVNPAAGCLPQIVQILVLIAFFQAFNQVLRADGEIVAKLNQVLYSFLKFPSDAQINTQFFFLNLTEPDVIQVGKLKLPGIFLILAAAIQFWSTKVMSPVLSQSQQMADKTPGEADDLAVSMQKQMVYFFPFMTLIIGLTFPSGLVLYWLTFSLTNLLQQLWINKTKKK